jgi:hypothetical protein
MTEFFKSLSAIGDTLRDNRIRSDRASALAGMADSTDPADYDFAVRKLIGLGDLQGSASLASLWQRLAQAKRAQDAAAMYLASRQASASPEAAANAVPRSAPVDPAAPEIGEGATATNPQTGAKVIMRGGQWVPAQ